MINDIERDIIKKFVCKHRQERLIWEFGNSRKREQIMMQRFAGPQIFKEDYLKATEYMSPDVLQIQLFKLGGTKNVYYIGESYIGEMSLKQATETVNTGEICIVYCGNGIGYYQGEEEFGYRPRYFLIAK